TRDEVSVPPEHVAAVAEAERAAEIIVSTLRDVSARFAEGTFDGCALVAVSPVASRVCVQEPTEYAVCIYPEAPFSQGGRFNWLRYNAVERPTTELVVPSEALEPVLRSMQPVEEYARSLGMSTEWVEGLFGFPGERTLLARW